MHQEVVAVFLALFCLIMGLAQAWQDYETKRLQWRYWDAWDRSQILWYAVEGMNPLPEGKSLEECEEAFHKADDLTMKLEARLERR